MHWETYSVTDAGKVRTVNEDSIYLNNDQQIWAVADGMGGHHRGDFASQTVVENLHQYTIAEHTGISLQRIDTLLSNANKTLINKAELEGGQIIASTCAILTCNDDRIICSWVGDSRIYRFRDNTLTLLTRDHSYESLVMDARNNGQEFAGAAVNLQALTRGVGAEPTLEVEHCHYFAKPGDRYLLCTDGLYKEISQEELSSCFSTIPCNRTLTDVLHQTYLQNGARDNLGLVIVSATE